MLRYLILSLAVTYVSAKSEFYKGYQLLSLTPRSDADVGFLVNLFETKGEVDVWQLAGVNRPCVIMVPPRILGEIKSKFSERRLKWDVLSKDLDAHADESYKDVASDDDFKILIGQALDVSHRIYRNLSQIDTALNYFKTQFPRYVMVGEIGTTYEKRSIKYIKISTSPRAENSQKRSIMLVGGIHAREWISTSSLLYVVHKMLLDNSEIRYPGYDMIRKLDWYVIFVANPDGYAYTHSKARYWLKNRSRRTGNCKRGDYSIGVDLNRNFEYNYRKRGCGTSYAGIRAFSELETSALQTFITKLKDSLTAYVSVHAFAQAILLPWFGNSNSSVEPANYQKLETVAHQMAHYISNLGSEYRVISVTEAFGDIETGTSVDWVLHEKPDVVALRMELRPDNRYIREPSGFSPKTSDILLQGREFFQGLVGLFHHFFPLGSYMYTRTPPSTAVGQLSD